MSDEITITRKYVIYPIASDMKEWERKVIKYVSENYEKRIQLLEQKIKHSKIPKEEKENLRKELDNLKIKYDAFQQMGGKLSFCLCMLDEENSGFMLNSVHSTEGCYTYTKEIINGKAMIDLGKEEEAALKMAVGDDD